MSLEIEAGWLSEDILLASVPVAEPETVDVRVTGDAGVVIETRRLAYDASTLLMIRLIPPPAAGLSTTLSVRTRAGEARVDLDRTAPDLQSLCRDRLARLDGATRGRVLEFLTAALHWPPQGPARVRLSQNLLLARDALRERLPYSQTAADGSARLQADAIVSADERTFVVTGAMADTDEPVASLVAVSPEGLRADLLPRLCRHPHRRVPELVGFTGSCALNAPSVLDEGWRLELRLAGGDAREVRMPRVVRDLAAGRRALLAALAAEGEPGDTLIREHLFPCLDRLQHRLRADAVVERVEQYGTPCASPEVSIVIACGQRVDLIEHQLAQFVHDPDLFDADVVYVQDARVSRDRLADRAAHLQQLYRVPFRIATLSHDAGFAAAIDAASGLARAPLLVVLAPDAFPAGSGWLSRLLAGFRHRPGTGAAVPSLLALDGSACDPAAQPAAACFLIERALLSGLGGLRGRYTQSAAEMSDVCLRLSRANRHIAACPDVAFHLLREESGFGSRRTIEARYDQWVHAHVHGSATA